MEVEQQQQLGPSTDGDLAGMTFEQRLALLCDDDSDGEQHAGVDAAARLDGGSSAGSASQDDQQQEGAGHRAEEDELVDSKEQLGAAAEQEAYSSSSSAVGSEGPAVDAEKEAQQVCCTPLLPLHLASRATQTSPSVADAAVQVRCKQR
jgi:hypothetical protein